MSVITINGVTYTGNNITIQNGNVIIDNNNVTPNSKTITISVVGNIETLEVDSCSKIDVTGNITELGLSSGNITVKGNINS